MGERKGVKRDHQFGQIYEVLCSQKYVSPLAVIQANLTENRLRFCCDRISLEDWSPILNSLAADQSLVEIHAYSRYPRKKVHEKIDTQKKLEGYRRFGTPIICTNFLLRCFVDAVAVCASNSTALTSLVLDGIPLASRKYLDILSVGLAINRSLQHLSLARCAISDEGCGVLFGAVLEDTWIRTIDLTACSLTSNSASYLASFLQKKRIQLLDRMLYENGITATRETKVKRGLEKLVLDENRKFGDVGLHLLAAALKDDFWLKTLSVRHCGLTKAGGDAIIDLLETNTTIVTMNFGNNKLPAGIQRTVRRVLRPRQENAERTPLKRRHLNRKTGLKWRTERSLKKKRVKNRRRRTRQGNSKLGTARIKGNEESAVSTPNLTQLNDRLSNVIDCNRNLLQGLANERQLLANEKLSRLAAEQSFELLRPTFKTLLRGVQQQDGIRGKLLIESNLCANIRNIFNRLECIAAKNSTALVELSEKSVSAADKGSTTSDLSSNRFDEKRRAIRSVQKRPYCPSRHNS